MSLGLILEICFVWFLLLVATGLVCINLSPDVWRVLKRTWKALERGFAHETKGQIKAPRWKPGLDGARAASTK